MTRQHLTFSLLVSLLTLSCAGAGGSLRGIVRDPGFWDELYTTYGSHGAVYYENHHTVEVTWNSAARSFDSDVHDRRVIAILDAGRAESLRQWEIYQPYGSKFDEFEVRVYYRDGRREKIDDLHRQRIGGKLESISFAIPNFQDRMLIEITTKAYAGRGGIPYYEMPLTFDYPCRMSLCEFQAPNIAVPRTPLEHEMVKYLGRWRFVLPDGAVRHDEKEASLLRITWSWTDLAPRDPEPLMSEDLALPLVAVMGHDAKEANFDDFLSAYLDDVFRWPILDATARPLGFETGPLQDAPLAEKIHAVRAWIDEHVTTIDHGYTSLSAPRDPVEVLEEVGDPTDVCALATVLLRDLGVTCYPVAIHRPSISRLQTSVENPYRYNYMVLWVPGMDPDRTFSRGFVDVADSAMPTGVLGDDLTGCPAVLFQDTGTRTFATPEHDDVAGVVDVRCTGTLDVDGRIDGELVISLSGLAAHAAGVECETVSDPGDVLGALSGLLTLDERLLYRPEVSCETDSLGRRVLGFTFAVWDGVRDAGDLSLVDLPTLRPALLDADLADGERRYDLDYGFPCQFRVSTRLVSERSIAEADSTPLDAIHGPGLTYARSVAVADTVVEVTSSFRTLDRRVRVDEYEGVRGFLSEARGMDDADVVCRFEAADRAAP